MYAHNIQEQVTDRLLEAAPELSERVITYFVHKQITRITDAVVKGIETLDELEKERRKTGKPDMISYNSDGSVASQAYSKERLDANSKREAQFQKLTLAINKALEGDANALFDLQK